MNANQIISLVQTLIGIGCGYFVAQGSMDNSTATQITAGVVALVTFLVAHIFHADPPAPPPASPTSPLGAKLPILLAVAVAGTLALDLAGCGTTPQQVTYQAAATSVVSVDTAMNLWGAYVAADHPGTNAEATVKNAYEKYQAAMSVVCDAGEAYAATGGTNGTAQAALNTAIANAAHELTDLETLVAAFGVKLNP